MKHKEVEITYLINSLRVFLTRIHFLKGTSCILSLEMHTIMFTKPTLFIPTMIGQLAVMSAFLGPDQAATEALLATDPDVSPWVQKYQRSRETVSQTDYEVSLIISNRRYRLVQPAWFEVK